MQMGRWFGYRPGYLDLCRLYTTSDLVEWFGHIADASEELREEFDAMAESGATPRDYGLKVQSHPILMVTSPLKMRTAKNLQLSFSGELVETVAFYRDPVNLRKNLAAVNQLIAGMGVPSETDPVRDRGEGTHDWKGFLWNGVSADVVTYFFSSYTTHPKAWKVNSALLAEFIRKMASSGELKSWTVALIGGGTCGEQAFQGGLKVERQKRAPDPKIKEHYSIGRLLSPRDEALDLDGPAWKAALEATIGSWETTGRKKRVSEPKPPLIPSGASIRKIRGEGVEGVAGARDRGLLLLYALDPTEAGLEDPDVPVMAFGASFPVSSSETRVEYKVDHQLWEREYGPAD
jgi:hypothetical protein